MHFVTSASRPSQPPLPALWGCAPHSPAMGLLSLRCPPLSWVSSPRLPALCDSHPASLSRPWPFAPASPPRPFCFLASLSRPWPRPRCPPAPRQGGTGAAPSEFQDSLGMPARDGLRLGARSSTRAGVGLGVHPNSDWVRAARLESEAAAPRCPLCSSGGRLALARPATSQPPVTRAVAPIARAVLVPGLAARRVVLRGAPPRGECCPAEEPTPRRPGAPCAPAPPRPPAVNSMLTGCGLREQTKLIVAGKASAARESH